MAREVDDLEAGEPVTFANGPVDVHRTAVPDVAVREAVEQAHVERQVLHPPVVPPARALRLLDGVRMAEDVGVCAQSGRGAAVIGVAVAEDHARDPAVRDRGGHDRRGHALLARVEDEHAAALLVAEEIDVHRARQPPAHEPHAVGDLLGRSGGQGAQARA